MFKSANGMELTLHTTGQRAAKDDRAVIERTSDGLRATLTMREGESARGRGA